MDQPLISDAELLARIEAFRARYRMKVSAFGRGAVGDASLIKNLQDGRSLTLKTAQRVLDFMARHPATIAPNDSEPLKEVA
jgi:hypothetical protein